MRDGRGTIRRGKERLTLRKEGPLWTTVVGTVEPLILAAGDICRARQHELALHQGQFQHCGEQATSQEYAHPAHWRTRRACWFGRSTSVFPGKFRSPNPGRKAPSALGSLVRCPHHHIYQTRRPLYPFLQDLCSSHVCGSLGGIGRPLGTSP
jgi:hypothetical protein